MAASIEDLAFTLDAIRPQPMRREPRADTVRIVEYTRFPRVGPDSARRVGFTRDLSAWGLCIGADDPETPGSLLRVIVREVDGRASRPTIARVVWCSETEDERFWIGLEQLTGGPTDRVREARR
jgi:hypothetical protein